MKPAVISLCDESGVMVRPWLDAGYDCYTVDLAHDPGEHQDAEGIYRVGADVRAWWPDEGLVERAAFVAAFPPCTDLAVSGARWFQKKGLRALSEAVDIFGACVNLAEYIGAPALVENPVSTISTYYRKPDYTFDPCDYGDPYTKKTCLWAFNGFRMPPKSRIEPTLGSKMHLLPPSAERARLRSVTPEGFARAVFEANRR